jgi:uncharacterized protein (DUF2235 family)
MGLPGALTPLDKSQTTRLGLAFGRGFSVDIFDAYVFLMERYERATRSCLSNPSSFSIRG